MHAQSMGLLEFTICRKLTINLYSPVVKRAMLRQKAFVICKQDQSFHIGQMVQGRGSQGGIFKNRREWQKQTSYMCLGVLATAASSLFRRGFWKSGSSSLYQVSGGKLSSNALSEHHLSPMIIKDKPHSLSMSVGVLHSVVLPHRTAMHVDISQTLSDLIAILRTLLFILSLMGVY